MPGTVRSFSAIAVKICFLILFVTAKMKRYFWAKFMQTKDESWRRMALMKVGKVITMPERRFIGNGPDTQRIIRVLAVTVIFPPSLWRVV